MHGMNVKIIEAQQARLFNRYKNTKLKLLKTNAAVGCNKMYKFRHLKPKYINIKINGKKSQDKKTTTNAIKYRINQEIRFVNMECSMAGFSRPRTVTVRLTSCSYLYLCFCCRGSGDGERKTHQS